VLSVFATKNDVEALL